MNKTTTVVFDFETFYSAKYSVKTMSYTDYVDDERFLVHGMAVCGGVPAEFLGPDDVPAFFAALPERTILVSHNSLFDLTIIACHYRLSALFHQKRFSFIDSMGLAALLRGNYTRLNLDALTGQKTEGLANTKGKRGLAPEEYEALAKYAVNDAQITEGLLRGLLREGTERLGRELLRKELQVMDYTLKLLLVDPALDRNTRPVLCLDRTVLEGCHRDELQKEDTLLSGVAAALRISTKELEAIIRSRVKFPKLLETHGVAVPKKISPTTGKETWAMAKSDTAFLQLLERYGITEDTDVEENIRASDPETLIKHLLLMKVRLGSTILRTRSERMLRLNLEGQDTFPMPVYLRYYGAQNTGRWSGENKLNQQNFPRGSLIRSAIVPPPGHKIIVCDFSSVEARVLAWLAGEDELLDAFRANKDVYIEQAKKIWPSLAGLPDKVIKDEHGLKRQVSKVTILGLGYSAGWAVLERLLRLGLMGPAVLLDRETAEGLGVEREWVMDRLQRQKDWRKEQVGDDPEKLQDAKAWWEGLMLPLQKDPLILWHYGAAMRLVDIYREANRNIVLFWKRMGALDGGEHCEWIEETYQGVPTMTLRLPDGSLLPFPHLRYSDDERGRILYRQKGVIQHTYSARLAENATQATARALLRDVWIEAVRAGIPVCHSVHDELVSVVPERDAEDARSALLEIMSKAPAWAPDLPVAAEAKILDTYAEK